MFFSSASSSSSRAKMVNKRRDYTEEFNTNIRFIQTEIASLVDSNNNELKISTEDGLSPWADKASNLIEGNKSN